MIASEESGRTGAAAMCYWLESRLTPGCVPECMCGSGWIGTWRIPRGRRSCPCAVTSVLELHSSFGCTVREGRNHEHEKSGLACSAHFDCYPSGSSANQAH